MTAAVAASATVAPAGVVAASVGVSVEEEGPLVLDLISTITTITLQGNGT